MIDHFQANKVSIIMPCYNGESHLEEAVESVLAQSYDNWELLISDNGSVDGSLKIIENYAAADQRIRLIDGSHVKGVSHARNEAIEAATGHYIAFLDCDDIWHPEKLSRQIEFMQKANIKFSLTSYQAFIGSRYNTQYKVEPMRDAYSYTQILAVNPIGCLTSIYDASYYGRRYFPKNIPVGEDTLLWLELCKSSKAHCLHKILGYYRQAKDSASGNKIHAAHYRWRLLRKELKLNICTALYYFSIYAMVNLWRRKGMLIKSFRKEDHPKKKQG